MTALHVLNAVLWFANAAVWFGYTHNTPMGIASLGAAVLSLVMARNA
jgi:hypothetical protein